MTKHLIQTNETLRAEAFAMYNLGRDAVNFVVQQYAQLKLPALTPGEFPRLFTDTENLLYDKMTGGEGVTLQGIKLDKAKAMEIMAKPEGYAELKAAIAKLAMDAKEGWRVAGTNSHLAFALPQIANLFKLEENGTVALSDCQHTYCEEAGKSYVHTERGKAVANFCTDVAAAFYKNGLDKYFRGDTAQTFPIPDIVQQAIHSLDQKSRSFRFDTDGIRRYDQQG